MTSLESTYLKLIIYILKVELGIYRANLSRIYVFETRNKTEREFILKIL